jgi:hypothetical protein
MLQHAYCITFIYVCTTWQWVAGSRINGCEAIEKTSCCKKDPHLNDQSSAKQRKMQSAALLHTPERLLSHEFQYNSFMSPIERLLMIFEMLPACSLLLEALEEGASSTPHDISSSVSSATDC